MLYKILNTLLVFFAPLYLVTSLVYLRSITLSRGEIANRPMNPLIVPAANVFIVNIADLDNKDFDFFTKVFGFDCAVSI